MSLQPLWEASGVIQVHALAAMASLVLAFVQFASTKGTALHRALGYFWVGLMLLAAFSSFWVNTIRLLGPFSPIHLLSIYTIAVLPSILLAARRGDIAKHKRGMTRLVVLGLVIPGVLAALMPGRVMHQVLFGP